jgi:hypothetical protein
MKLSHLAIILGVGSVILVSLVVMTGGGDPGAVGTTPLRGGCWDTGCQPLDWAVRGCDQFGMVTTATKWCQGGNIFTCCPRSPDAN